MLGTQKKRAACMFGSPLETAGSGGSGGSGEKEPAVEINSTLGDSFRASRYNLDFMRNQGAEKQIKTVCVEK
jgi:hypothetical protein